MKKKTKSKKPRGRWIPPVLHWYCKIFDIRYWYWGESNLKPMARKSGIAGLSTTVAGRWWQIDFELKGSRERVQFWMLLPWAEFCEQCFLRITKFWFKMDMPKHAGYTEWRKLGWADPLVLFWYGIWATGSWCLFIVLHYYIYFMCINF